MDDAMIDLMPGDAIVRRRLEAYADERLTPDLATSSRLRARVLAVAHRHADLARADAALSVIPGALGASGTAFPVPRPRVSGGATPRSGSRRPLAVLLAAALALVAAGTALAARPGGPAYEARVWVETLALPTGPADRAVAQLTRLDARLAEARAASETGDQLAAHAALTAYERILDEASREVIAAGDPVAVAALETGVGANVAVLQVLAERLPDQAAGGIAGALEHAIDHSDDAIRLISGGRPDDGGTGPDAGQPGDRPGTGEPGVDDPGSHPEKTPAPEPTGAPTPFPVATPQPTPRPTRPPVVAPTPRPTGPPTVDPTPRPTPDGGPPDDAGPPDATPGRGAPGPGGGGGGD